MRKSEGYRYYKAKGERNGRNSDWKCYSQPRGVTKIAVEQVQF